MPEKYVKRMNFLENLTSLDSSYLEVFLKKIKKFHFFEFKFEFWIWVGLIPAQPEPGRVWPVPTGGGVGFCGSAAQEAPRGSRTGPQSLPAHRRRPGPEVGGWVGWLLALGLAGVTAWVVWRDSGLSRLARSGDLSHCEVDRWSATRRCQLLWSWSTVVGVNI